METETPDALNRGLAMVQKNTSKRLQFYNMTVRQPPYTSDLPQNSRTIVFRTILALVKSVAVHSMNKFFVFNEIAECAPLIIGGRERTRL